MSITATIWNFVVTRANEWTFSITQTGWWFKITQTVWNFDITQENDWKFKITVPYEGYWILREGFLDDNGIWIDTEIWID